MKVGSEGGKGVKLVKRKNRCDVMMFINRGLFSERTYHA
jgi:hypothetical protein